MNIKDILWLCYKDISEKKVRTGLTVLMVVIGIAAIVALLSQTAGISASVSSTLSSLGPTSIILTSTGSTGFTTADTGDISSLPNVSVVIPILTSPVTLRVGSLNESTTLIGITSEGLQELLGSANIYQGALYQDTVAPDAVTGHTTAFPSSGGGSQEIQVGDPATLIIGAKGGKTVTVPVVGILQPYGSSIIPVDSGVVMSLTAAEAMLQKTYFNTILVKATNTSSVTALSSLITQIYGSRAHVFTTQELLSATSSILGAITTLFEIVGGVSLLVAAVGIMNIMLIAVFERTHEIGVMKALGFKNRHILLIFLFQALIIGVLGGIVGIGVGAGTSYALTSVFTHSSAPATSSTAHPSGSLGGGGSAGFGGPGIVSGTASSTSSLSYHPVFTLATIGSALLVAVLVSIVAGVYPAWRASRMEPIDALREL